MKKGLGYLIINGISLWVLDQLFVNVYISSLSSLIVLTLIFGICNSILKPILQLFSFPISVMTLGLFTFVINGFILGLSFALVPGVQLDGFGTAIIASITLSIVNWALERILMKK